MLTALWQDLKYALRAMKRNPGLTAICAATLALGIGANTAIFSVVDAVLLRPLPFPHPERLVSLKSDLRGFGVSDIGMSVVEFEDFRDRSGVFDDITFVWPMHGNLTGVDKPERIEALTVGPNYFHLLGRYARMGRTFRNEDVRPGMCDVAVLSDAAWKRLFGADPRVLGRKIRLDYDPFTIIGVMPPGFRHPGSTLQGEVDFWITGGFGAYIFNRNSRVLRRIPGVIARLHPGVTPAAAQARLDAFAAGLRRAYPNDYPAAASWSPRLQALKGDLAGHGRRVLLVLSGALALVLLICCATIATLLLARSTARRREFAIRGALGAGRGDLIRQLAVESLVLAAVGGAAGLLLASWLIPVLVEFAPLGLPRVNHAGLNGTVLAFTMLGSMAAAALSGLAPALQISKVDLVTDLKTGAGTAGAARHRAQACMVACQIAFSLMLMAGAGLLLKSFWNLMQVNPGFNPKNVVVASLWLAPPMDPQAPKLYRSPQQRTGFVREVLRRVRELPGVELAAVGAGNSIPLLGWNATPFGLEDADVPPGESLSAQLTSVSPDFQRVMGARLISGRLFTEADDGQNLVALIDQTMAARFWKNRSPLGRRIRAGLGVMAPQWWTIVGVVSNMKTDAFDAPDAPHIYLPIYQRSNQGVTVFLRTAADPGGMAQALRRAIQAIDPDMPLFGVRTMEDVVSHSMAERRFAHQVIGAFAFVALALAAMGVYGVMAFSVGRRTREIGLRVAPGAGRGQVLGMILGQGMRLAAWGLALGLAGAWLLTRFLESLLFGAAAADPATFVCVSAVLLCAALAACYFPARRAAKVDPTVALRAE